MLEGLHTMYSLQRSLSSAQATPIVGPIFVSPVKAVVSTGQLITGLAIGILFGSACVAYQNGTCARASLTGFSHAGHGIMSLMYSIANMLSFGTVGFAIESTISNSSQRRFRPLFQ